jgi:uncharacterized protein
MDRNDQQAIEQLFGKLAAVERQAPQRDAESEAFIQQQIASNPGAPYYMAQTIVVQEQALQNAQSRIEELEAQASQAPRSSGGGLFGSIFGNDRQPTAARGSVPRVGGRPGGAAPATGASPFGNAAPAGRAGGGGFLAGAASTAMGVAGGMLLANALGGMFGADEAQAAEAEPAVDEQAAVEDEGFDEGGFDDADFGDTEF